ncbi:MAG: hypothetical protein M5R36_12520 [Deltaproteobacteria bacterium]|nr:hypothetical protein [Deltaproteobacteria bacterium]
MAQFFLLLAVQSNWTEQEKDSRHDHRDDPLFLWIGLGFFGLVQTKPSAVYVAGIVGAGLAVLLLYRASLAVNAPLDERQFRDRPEISEWDPALVERRFPMEPERAIYATHARGAADRWPILPKFARTYADPSALPVGRTLAVALEKIGRYRFEQYEPGGVDFWFTLQDNSRPQPFFYVAPDMRPAPNGPRVELRLRDLAEGRRPLYDSDAEPVLDMAEKKPSSFPASPASRTASF